MAHDGVNDDWYASLKQPGGASCCDRTDCAPTVDWRPRGDGYEVKLSDAWVPVPPERVITDKGNPVGQAVLCHKAGPPPYILCFVPGTLY